MDELQHLFTALPSTTNLTTVVEALGKSTPGVPNNISPLGVALAAALIIVNGGISVWLSLELEVQLAVAAVRCIVQLGILGYILVPIFTYDLWWLVVGYAFIMAFVGSWEAVSRPAYKFKGMLAEVFGAVVASSAVFLSYAMLLIIRTDPWWDAQYFIPVLGMLLGNCISGISVGLSTLLDELTSGKDNVELLLAVGASRWEATREVLQRAVKVAMTPVLNQMNVVGIVSIPGMMTGQILGGQDPSQAARYQMVIMFLIAATTGIGCVASILMAIATVIDNQSRIRPERLTKKRSRGAAVSIKIQHAIYGMARAVRNVFKRRPSEQTTDDQRRPLLGA